MGTQNNLWPAEPKRIIRGLSLSRPWSVAFLKGPEEKRKRCENRDWPPPRFILNQYIALHSAKSWDEGARPFISNRLGGLWVPDNAHYPHSEIFAVARCVGYVESALDERLPDPQRQWFIGPYCWLLDEFVALPEPIASRGYPGLWPLSEEIERQIQAFIAEGTIE